MSDRFMSNHKLRYCLYVWSSIILFSVFADDKQSSAAVSEPSAQVVQSDDASDTQKPVVSVSDQNIQTQDSTIALPTDSMPSAQTEVAEKPASVPMSLEQNVEPLNNTVSAEPVPMPVQSEEMQSSQTISAQQEDVQAGQDGDKPLMPLQQIEAVEQSGGVPSAQSLQNQDVSAISPLDQMSKSEDSSSKKSPETMQVEKPESSVGALPKESAIIAQPQLAEPKVIIENPSVESDAAKTEQEKSHSDYAYLGSFLKPWELNAQDKLIEINFENAQLINFIKYFEKEYGLTFILDNVIEPMNPPNEGKNPVGIRISFKTEKPLSKKQAWDLFISFLDMNGLMVIPGPSERIYQITSNNPNSKFASSKEPIPTFIGIDPSLLPTSDLKIRYVYFIQNTTPATVTSVVEKLGSPIASKAILVNELNALILTDRASNIQTILLILKELDKPILPETLTVLKLKKTEAKTVADLYEKLKSEESNLFPRLAPWARKQSIGYFTENVRLVPDRRTNSLIILGPRQNVKKIEDFILKEIDREIDLPYSPLHVYPLKFIDAEATSKIINDLKGGFQTASTAGQLGGLIGGTRFIKPTVTITAEKLNNSLIINADYDDYLQIYELLEKIDVEQPQVAIRILVLDVTLTDNKKFGMQMRTPVPFLGNVNGTSANFQNSGLPITDTENSTVIQRITPATTDTGVAKGSLLGDLINLVVGMEAGSTVLTLPADSLGVYGILKMLQSITNVSVIAKPFLVTSHKYNASIDIAETRRVTTANIVGGGGTPQQQSQGDLSAGLTINISPQISPDDYVTLDVTVKDSQFTQPASTSATDIATGNRNEKVVKSSVILADNQVLALGGIIIDRELESIYKVPLLGDIPLLGWFFKSKTKVMVKTSLLILISAQIVRPQSQELIDGFTKQRLEAAKGVLGRMDNDDQHKDPIHRWFFKDPDYRFSNNMDKILSVSSVAEQMPVAQEAPKTELKSGRPFIMHTSSPKEDLSDAPAVQGPASSKLPGDDVTTPVVKTDVAQVATNVVVPDITKQQLPAAETASLVKTEDTTEVASVDKVVQPEKSLVTPEQQAQNTEVVAVSNQPQTETPNVAPVSNNRRRLRQFVPSTEGAGTL